MKQKTRIGRYLNGDREYLFPHEVDEFNRLHVLRHIQTNNALLKNLDPKLEQIFSIYAYSESNRNVLNLGKLKKRYKLSEEGIKYLSDKKNIVNIILANVNKPLEKGSELKQHIENSGYIHSIYSFMVNKAILVDHTFDTLPLGIFTRKEVFMPQEFIDYAEPIFEKSLSYKPQDREFSNIY